MTDSVEIALIVAIPPTLTGLAALVTSIMNGINARRASRLAIVAAEKAETAADAASAAVINAEEAALKTGEVQIALSENTALTSQTKKVVEQVHQYVNSARERQDTMIAQAMKDIESLGLAVGILQEKLVAAEAEKARLAEQVRKE